MPKKIFQFTNYELLRAIIYFKKKLKPQSNIGDENFGIEIFESYVVNNYLVASQSIDDYIKGKKSPKRIFIAYFIQLINWINLVKYLSIYFVNDQWIWKIFADPLYSTGRSDILSLVIGLVFLLISISCEFLSNNLYKKIFHKLISQNATKYLNFLQVYLF